MLCKNLGKCLSRTKTFKLKSSRRADIILYNNNVGNWNFLGYYRLLNAVYCFCFAVKRFHGLTSFLSLSEKLSRLPVTLPILGTLDSNIHGKT